MGSLQMLRSKRDFAAVQRSNKSRVHRLLVARFVPNGSTQTRIGLSTGRKLGGAVVRNRVRRRIRERLRALSPRLAPGWDILIVCRPPAGSASFAETSEALERVLSGGGLLLEPGTA